MHQTGTLQLTAEDLLLNENLLQEGLQAIFPFQAGSVSFPSSPPRGMAWEHGYLPLLEPEAGRLLVPLALEGELLGIFIALGVRGDDLPPLSFIQRYSELCLRNLSLSKGKEIHPLTCLYRQDAFLQYISLEIDQISNHLLASSSPVDIPEGECKGRFGLAVLEADHLASLQRGFGYLVAERFLQKLAEELSLQSPARAIIAHLESDRFGLLLPGSGPAECLSTCQAVQDSLDKVLYDHPATEEKLTSSFSCGWTVYPMDLHGQEIKTHSREKARVVLDKGLQALFTAQKLGGNRALSFSDILEHGGSIRSIDSGGRIRVDLGRKVRADEGHRFAVLDTQAPQAGNTSPGPRAKADVLLVEVGHQEALAEVLCLYAPFDRLCPGDRLQRLSPEDAAAADLDPEPPGASDSGVMSLRHFLACWQEHSRKANKFSLALCRIKVRADHLQSPQQEGDSHPLAEWIDSPRFRDLLPEGSLVGEYGSDSLAFYLPGMESDQGKEFASRLSALLAEKSHFEVSIGLASYPCLQFSYQDMLTNARYALEHAQLLPPPGIAVFDSVTLTMIGDRSFTAEDLPSAAEYYALALCLDSSNMVARNSLGICRAKLGDPGRAQREFETVLQEDPEDSMAWYNLGYVQLKQESWEAAGSSFKRCLELVPEHVYALVRLGQLAEKQGDLQQARAIYLQAGHTEQGARTAFKHLAKLDLQEGNTAQARSNLQQALVANPWDAEALYLLAGLYLSTGEDLDIAESLAKKCVSLRPDVETYRELLERIFRLQNKPLQAGLLYTRQAGPCKPEPFTRGSK